MDRFFAVSPLMIFPETMGRFKVYIRKGDTFFLFAKENEAFTRLHRQRLHENGHEMVYVQSSDRERYQSYIERNLAYILGDENIPVKERADVFYNASCTLVREVVETKLPNALSAKMLSRLTKFVAKCTEFLAQSGSLKQLSSLISHDYAVYTHSVNIFVYSSAMLQTFGLPEESIVAAGVGALLHDIGKMGIDKAILQKPGPLTLEERGIINTHPARGIAYVSHLPLDPLTTQCVLFHHERHNGRGYPAGLAGEAIAFPVRAVAVADVYDALTSRRPYAPAMSPFEALRVMRDDMRGAFDLEVFKRLVTVLSGANLI